MHAFSTFFKGLQLMAEVSNWSEKALADGKVTLREAVDLVERVAPILGIPVEIDFSTLDFEAGSHSPHVSVESPDRPKRTWE